MTDDEKSGMNRRAFLTRIGIGGACATGLITVGATTRYLYPAVMYEPAMKTKVGSPGEFSIGSSTFFPDSKFFVYKSSGGLYAISATCTHLGCIVSEEDDGFSCPCHGSVFTKNGNVVGGPAPRGLPWYEVTLSPEGQVVVDRGRPVPPGTKLVV